MDGLPGHLLDKVLFRINLRSLAMMRCTNKSIQSHIQDPYFVSEYFSRIESGLLRISTYGSNLLGYHHPHGGASSLRTKDILLECHILGCCSGLLLLFIDRRLCVANPLTKKFRFLNHSNQMKHHPEVVWPENKNQIGLAVNQIDRTTQSFKIVYIFEMKNNNETRYGFDINAGNSWRCSETTITCKSSYLYHRMKNPVYFNGSLHWLRNDGSIVAFNPETEQARLIPVKFPRRTSKMFFAAGDDRLTLISTEDKVIYVYALKNILSDPKWVLVKQIRNEVMDKKRLMNWYVQAYDGKCLVLCEGVGDRVVHVYDFRANNWVVTGPVPGWCDANQHFFLFRPSPSSVVGLDEILACGDSRISSLSSIMALIDGSSSEKVEKQLRKMLAEQEEKKLILANIEPSAELLYEQSTNKKRRLV